MKYLIPSIILGIIVTIVIMNIGDPTLGYYDLIVNYYDIILFLGIPLGLLPIIILWLINHKKEIINLDNTTIKNKPSNRIRIIGYAALLLFIAFNVFFFFDIIEKNLLLKFYFLVSVILCSLYFFWIGKMNNHG